VRLGVESVDVVGELAKARGKLYKTSHRDPAAAGETNSGTRATATDEHYASCLCLHSLPVAQFFRRDRPEGPIPITSINEDRLLTELGLSEVERSRLEGLIPSSSSSLRDEDQHELSQGQLSSRAVVRLACNPPQAVGTIQKLTTSWLLRPFPLGLRLSGSNMSPQPFWLCGAQSVALNMSNTDLPVQLHFALFDGCKGFLLKPPAMLASSTRLTSDAAAESANLEADSCWPPPHEMLTCTTIEVFSLHNLPKRTEQRPRFDGPHGACHRHVPSLSGAPAPPDALEQSVPGLTLSLHPIGGFCAISKVLPVEDVHVELRSSTIVDNGLNADFSGEPFHCIAAEPHAVFLRASISEDGSELAYDSCVLGRLRRGLRVIQLRNAHLGTRIELCYLLVRVDAGAKQPNLWASPQQQRIRSSKADERWMELRSTIAQEVQPYVDEVIRLKQKLAVLEGRGESINDHQSSVDRAEEPSKLASERPAHSSTAWIV